MIHALLSYTRLCTHACNTITARRGVHDGQILCDVVVYRKISGIPESWDRLNTCANGVYQALYFFPPP